MTHLHKIIIEKSFPLKKFQEKKFPSNMKRPKPFFNNNYIKM